ncbi:hypothetical protein [Mycobacteroides abscessus]|uniref:hypothetical protein n=1 Tax=Mycobacteroides abscessus TaxID=36809 RepID=UPI0005DAF4EF|nr:hypothetical protein [Mycobacteroides abscessus]CPW53268.1 Uncharacterised protein [Mycobacteroides abscessus]SKF43108.1 Uncharacterised protein [Mycobacteroides abscessus subsp. bolletii]SKH17537.1 Uncharacterised protein [Mycobacteroides abscessus subsp. bolletii]
MGTSGSVAIAPEDALKICDTLQNENDTMRAALGRMGNTVADLQAHSYISETMDAFQGKYEGESRVQAEKVINRADVAVAGTREVIRVQLERQASGAASVQRA